MLSAVTAVIRRNGCDAEQLSLCAAKCAALHMIKGCYVARNTPPVVGAQWTGIVTQIAIEMLESGKVEAVVCVQSQEQDRFAPMPVSSSTAIEHHCLFANWVGGIARSISQVTSPHMGDLVAPTGLEYPSSGLNHVPTIYWLNSQPDGVTCAVR